jgi:hypothetical protein
MRALPTLALLGLGLAPSAAFAQPKPPAKVTSVCPGKVLPLAVGNTWTYESVQARDSKGQPVLPPENMTKLLPLPAKKIIVTVTGAETDKKTQETTVKLKETITYDITKDPKVPKLFDQTVEGTIVCSTKGRFDVSPELFFFAGEPGGYRGIAFSRFERKKETTLKLTNNAIGEADWIEEITAEYKQEATKGSGAKLTGGKLEMERKFTPQPTEGVATRTQTYKTTERIGITTSGRIQLDGKLAPDGKPCTTKKLSDDKKTEIAVPTDICELPANWISNVWFADNVGLVQALNPYAHMYQLVESKLN